MPEDTQLLTLTEVSARTKISMPTLQRYKKLYQSRIPSEGKGRKQRYPIEALAIFEQLKVENVGRRGRPRKNAQAAPKAATARKAAKAAPAAEKKRGRPAGKKSVVKKSAAKPRTAEGLLTLTQIQSLTGISYPTLLRYVKSNINDIPHQGKGRARRFKPEAVAVFKDLRSRSKRGRKPKAATVAAAKPASRVAAAAATRKPSAGRGRPAKVVEPADLLARLQDVEKKLKALETLCAKQQRQLDRPYRLVLTRK